MAHVVTAAAPPRQGGRWRWIGSAAYVAGLAALTLAPVGWSLNRLTVRLYVFFKYDVPIAPTRALPENYGDLLNVLMYVPLAALLAGTRLRWWGALLLCVAGSIGTELVQSSVGREPEVRDVVANSAGALLGVALNEVLRRARRRAAGRGTR